MAYNYLFGPVPSRRLGMSLGVDLVPHKICSFNCIYCEVGATTDLTVTRKEYVDIKQVKNELDDFLSKDPELDYITFSGSGEPTLNNKLGDIVDYIKEAYPKYKLALLTNSSLLHDPNLRREIMTMDVILPSLDAVTENAFLKVNRPNPDLNVDSIIEGLERLRAEFAGLIWLEILFVKGYNDNERELDKMKEVLKAINPDQIQLNTVDRPGTESWAQPISTTKLKKIKDFLSPLPAKVVAKSTAQSYDSNVDNLEDKILETIKRRPCTADDIMRMYGLKKVELNKYLRKMEQEDLILRQKQERGIFYKTK